MPYIIDTESHNTTITMMIYCLLIFAMISSDLLSSFKFYSDTEASSVWISSSPSDFSAPGSFFTNCTLNSSGQNATISLNKGWGWKEITPNPSPPPRYWFGLTTVGNTTYDLLFGGNKDDHQLYSDTWVYDFSNGSWCEQFPKDSPIPRSGFAMSGVSNDDKVVLFGGYIFDNEENPIPTNDTWVYDLSENEWYNRTTPEAPPGRWDCAMTSISNTNKVLLFGGGKYSDTYNDTWVYDVDNYTWTKMSPTDSPVSRRDHRMSPVANNENVVLFGGLGYNGPGTLGYYLLDTWIYNYQEDRWYNKTPLNSPPERFQQGMATFFDTNEIIMFGGIEEGSQSDDTWIYNVSNNDWNVNISYYRPPHRGSAELGTVRNSHDVILFGGYGDGLLPLSDTWTLAPSIYSDRGHYISPYFITEGKTNFISLSWTAVKPKGTGIEFQTRTADSMFDLLEKPFIGPDGTSNSMYDVNSTLSLVDNNNTVIQYQVFFFSNMNQTLTPVLSGVRIDYSRVPDAPVLLSPKNDTWVNSSQPIFEWKFIDADDTQGNAFEWEITNSTNSTSPVFSSGLANSTNSFYIPDEPLKDGTWYWHVRTQDPAFNWGPFSSYWVIKIDTTPPNAFKALSNPNDWTNGQCNITYSTTDNTSGIDSYKVWIDGQPDGSQNSPMDLSNLSDGIHTILIRAYDRAGNYAEAKARAFIDRTKPEPFMPTAIPPSWTFGDPEISFETTDNTSGIDRYEVSLDSQQFSNQASPYILSNLSEGEHNVTVRAFDRAGNFRESEISVFLDRSSPTGLFISVDPANWTNKNPTITFSAIDNISNIDHYELNLNNGSFQNQTSPFIPANLPEGINTISVRAYDKAGNYQEGRVQAFIDRISPLGFQVTVEPGNWTNIQPTISFSTSDNVSGIDHYELKSDNGNFTQIVSPFKFSSLPDGVNNITVRAIDNAGNYIEASTTAYIDTIPPTKISLKINKGSGSTVSRNVILTISAIDNTSGLDQMCFSNDGLNYSAWEPFNTTKAWTLSSAIGHQTIFMKVRDKAGNEAAPVSSSIEHVKAQSGVSYLPVFVITTIIVLSLVIIVIYWKKRYKKPPIGRNNLKSA